MRRGGIASSFGSLVLSQVIGTGLGFAFWITAARAVAPEHVASASAAVAAMLLLGNLTVLGCGTLLLTELPLLAPDRQRALIRSGLIVVGSAAILAGTVWSLVGVHLSANFRAALHGDLAAPVFVLGVAATAVGLVLDQAVLGLRRPGLQVVRNLVASSLKFPLATLLVVGGTRSSFGLLLAWTLPLVVAPVLLWQLLRLPRLRHPRPDDHVRAHLRRYRVAALHNHSLSLSLQASALLVPMLAAGTLSAVAYAHFSLAWLVATFVFIPPFMLATALFAVSANDTVDTFRASMRRTLPVGLAISAGCYLGVLLLGNATLRTFGREYAAAGNHILRIVAIGGLALVVKDHFFAIYRVRRRMAAAARIAVLGVVVELIGASVGVWLDGVTGLCTGWLVAVYVEAVCMLPALARVLRSTSTPALLVGLEAA